MRGASWVIAATIVVAASGCTSDPPTSTPTSAPSAPSTTLSPTTATSAGPSPTVEAEYGCGPTDATQVTIRGRDVGDRSVVLELMWDRSVTDRTEPMTGPRVGAILEPHLPREAYDAGTAEVRIVDAEDRDEVLATATVDLRLDGGCG